MIKLKPRYLGLTLLIMANTATAAIEAAEKNRPEGAVLRNMTSFSIILHLSPTADTPVLQGKIGVIVNGFSLLVVI